MARKRMFDNDVVDQDSFMDLPNDAKALYFLLGMKADDEGFVSPRSIMRIHQISEDSLKLLILKKFVIPFSSGVVVITDWKRNNYLDKNKIVKTIYTEELKELVYDKDTKKYALNTAVKLSVNQSLEEVKPKLNQSLTGVKPEFNESLHRVEESRGVENRIEECRREENRGEQRESRQPFFNQSQDSYFETMADSYAEQQNKKFPDPNSVYYDERTKKFVPFDKPEEHQNQVNGDMLAQVRFGNEIKQIMEHLDRKTNAKNRTITVDTIMILTQWLNEGFKVEEIQRMISFKCKEWLGNEKTEIWCRPSTLFSEKNFKRYMEESAGYEDLEDECRKKYNYL